MYAHASGQSKPSELCGAKENKEYLTQDGYYKTGDLAIIDEKALRADILTKLKEERIPEHTIKSPNITL